MRFCLFLLLSFLAMPLWAHKVQRPEKPQYTFAVHENFSGLQESDVLFLFRLLEKEYGNSIGNRTLSISADFNWLQPYMGAGSKMLDGEFSVMIWGGMVRAPFMNVGVLSSILCHEIGHRLGGPPHQIFDGKEDWSSAEGQSDHFAATQCLPKLYRILKNTSQSYLQQEKEDMSTKICKKVPLSERAQCEWVATAGIDMIQFLQVYYNFDLPIPNPENSPTEKVRETLHTQYPSPQCRMEIFKVGAACLKGAQCQRLPCWFRTPSRN